MDSPELHQEVSWVTKKQDCKKDRGERLVQTQSLAVSNEACLFAWGEGSPVARGVIVVANRSAFAYESLP